MGKQVPISSHPDFTGWIPIEEYNLPVPLDFELGRVFGCSIWPEAEQQKES